MKLFESSTYFALYNPEFSVGVHKKVMGTVGALEAMGGKAKHNCYRPSWKGLLAFLIDFASCKDDLIYLRFSDFIAPFFLVLGVYHRLQGRMLVVDVPTPRRNSLFEMKLNISNPVFRVIRQLFCILNGPWVLLPASLIVQYSAEGRWFDLLVKKKTLLMGNPIDTKSPVAIASGWQKGEELKLVAVAQFADWHGIDRLLEALKVIRDKGFEKNIHLDLVGDGPAVSSLLDAIDEEGYANVEYHGVVRGEKLDALLAGCHLGVSSLALYRVKLDVAGVLKTREYLIRGIPVIGCGQDPDFGGGDAVYRHVFPNDESIDEIAQYLIDVISGKIELPLPYDCREFAINRFDFEIKIKSIVDRL